MHEIEVERHRPDDDGLEREHRRQLATPRRAASRELHARAGREDETDEDAEDEVERDGRNHPLPGCILTRGLLRTQRSLAQFSRRRARRRSRSGVEIAGELAGDSLIVVAEAPRSSGVAQEIVAGGLAASISMTISPADDRARSGCGARDVDLARALAGGAPVERRRSRGSGRREVVVSGCDGSASMGETAAAGGAHSDGGSRRA